MPHEEMPKQYQSEKLDKTSEKWTKFRLVDIIPTYFPLI